MSARSSSTPAPKQEALHEVFSWLHPSLAGNQYWEFLALTRNICHGAATIAQIAHRNVLEKESDLPLVLGVTDMERLELMATSSLMMLADYATREIEQSNARARAEVKS